MLSEDETKSNPVSESATKLADEVEEIIFPHAAALVEVQELQYVLRKPHLKALFQTHDCIASNDYTLQNVEDNMHEEVLVEFAVRPENNSTVDTECADQNYENERLTTPVIETQKDIKNAPLLATSVVENRNAEPALDELQQVPFDNDSSTLQSTNNYQESAEEINDQAHETDFQSKELKVAAVMANGNKRDYPLEVKISEVTGHGLNSAGCEGQASMNNRKELGVKEVIGEVREPTSKKEMTKPPVPTNGNKTAQSGDTKTPKHGLKTVRVFRGTKETLGLTVKVVEKTESIVVARILSGGLADTSGSLHVGDEIIELNDNSVQGMTANEVAELMDEITGSVKIKIVPARNEKKFTREAKISVRAFFDYDPVDDPLIPCKEVGVAFKRGDVLHVLNLEDPNWWQARKDGYGRDTTGLIPSKDFQEKRQRCLKINEGRQKEKNNARPLLPFPKWKRRKTDSNKLLCNFQQDLKKEEFPVYEQVTKYLESSGKKRPLLLIGPSGVGRNELKKMLLSSSPDKFTTTIPHTSRLKRPHETSDRDYFFVSRQTMESFIQNGKFIEFGEYKGCLYGTSKDSIKRAMKSGKTCVLKVEPEVTLLLRSADFKPFCVYVKPPPLHELRTSRLTVGPKSSKGKSSMRTFQDEDLQEMITESEVLEDSYGHLFDLTVVNKDLERAYITILEAVENLLQQPRWVPLDWIQDK